MAICTVTILLVPSLWTDWLTFLLQSSQSFDDDGAVPIPLLPRLIAGALVVIWGARADRPWTVVVAATLALPVLWIAGLAMLMGVIPALRGNGREFQGTELLRQIRA